MWCSGFQLVEVQQFCALYKGRKKNIDNFKLLGLQYSLFIPLVCVYVPIIIWYLEETYQDFLFVWSCASLSIRQQIHDCVSIVLRSPNSATADTSQLIDPWALLLISAQGRTEQQGDCRSERGIDDTVLSVRVDAGGRAWGRVDGGQTRTLHFTDSVGDVVNKREKTSSARVCASSC